MVGSNPGFLSQIFEAFHHVNFTLAIQLNVSLETRVHAAFNLIANP